MYKLNMYMLSELSCELKRVVVNQDIVKEWSQVWVFDEGLDGNYELGVCCKEVQSLLDIEIGF